MTAIKGVIRSVSIKRADVDFSLATADGGLREVVDYDWPAPPYFSADPAITGVAQVGETLTGVDGIVVNGSVTARAWLRDGVAISGATGSTYTLVAPDDVGAVITFRNTATGAGGSVVATSAGTDPVAAEDAALTSVAADGWQATVPSPTDLSLSSVSVDRAGFDATGTAATLNETLYLTKRVRQAYPNEASFTADQVAANDYIMAADTVAGAVNNSTKVSPKPIANWVMPSRLTVGDEIEWEISAFHYFGIASVWVRANDGTNQTDWQVVSTTSVSSYVEDPVPVLVYRNRLSVTGIADPAQAWLEAQVFPRVGTSASVLKSEDLQTAGKTHRAFTRRYFRRDTTLAATFPKVYVASTGNDTTGVCSTDDATALASPCLTWAGAWAKARATFPTGAGALDNLHIYIVDAVNTGTLVFNTYQQDIGAVITTRASGTSRAAAALTMTAAMRTYCATTGVTNAESAFIFKDMSFIAGGAFAFQGETARRMFCQFWNVNFDCGGFNHAAAMRNNAHLQFFGVAMTNMGANGPFGITNATTQMRGMRGVSGNHNNTTPDGWLTIGCEIIGTNAPALFDASEDGHIWAFNKYLERSGSAIPIHYRRSTAGDLGSVAIVQNLIEHSGTGTQGSIRISADAATTGAAGDNGNITHAVIIHNTVAGDDNYGRANIAYDEHDTNARTHDFIRCVGNNFHTINTKGDVFDLNGTRTGNFPFVHGVGCEGNFTELATVFPQDYAGIGTVIGGGDPLFTNDQSVTVTGGVPTAGTPPGDYTLQAGSPARDLFSKYLLSHDIAGNARPTSGTVDAGAYA